MRRLWTIVEHVSPVTPAIVTVKNTPRHRGLTRPAREHLVCLGRKHKKRKSNVAWEVW